MASLRVRLALLVTLAVACVIGIQAWVEITVFETRVEADLRETAELTAQAVADEVEILPEPLDRTSLDRSIHGYVALPPIRDVSVFAFVPGTPWSVTTEPEARPDERDVATQAFESQTLVWGPRTGVVQTVAAPITRSGEPFGAATVTVSLLSAQQMRARGRVLTFWFALAAVCALTLVMDVLLRAYVHRPLGRILETMARAGAGRLDARTPVERADEIGAVAAGLNEMLDRLEQANESLQERVADATAELQQRNREMLAASRRVLALREALARAEQKAAAGQTVADLAHQIGTPLNLISGHVQLMIEEEARRSSDERRRARLQTIEEQIQKVSGVVRSTLDAVRPPPARHEIVHIGPMLDRIADLVRPQLEAADIRLEIDVAADTPTVLADAVQLELALLNLVGNSIDAMPTGGTVVLRAARTPDGVRLTVADTGLGIPPVLLPRIFEPWVTTKAPGRGTGLGLSITREVISMLGGRIAAQSVVGEGTEFVIELPAAPAAQPA